MPPGRAPGQALTLFERFAGRRRACLPLDSELSQKLSIEFGKNDESRLPAYRVWALAIPRPQATAAARAIAILFVVCSRVLHRGSPLIRLKKEACKSTAITTRAGSGSSVRELAGGRPVGAGSLRPGIFPHWSLLERGAKRFLRDTDLALGYHRQREAPKRRRAGNKHACRDASEGSQTARGCLARPYLPVLPDRYRNQKTPPISATVASSPGAPDSHGVREPGACPAATRPATRTPASPSPATSPEAARTPGSLSSFAESGVLRFSTRDRAKPPT